MSIPISYLINDAAEQIGDPARRRVGTPAWLLFFNKSARELSEKCNVMQYRARFNLGTQALYDYPAEMTVFTGVEVNETPDNDDTWRTLSEKFQDEFRALTYTNYPTGSLPDSYFADRIGFYLLPRPDTAITSGGRMIYFGLPDRVVDETQDFQLRELAQDYVVTRMVTYALKARNRHAEADSMLAQWYGDIEGLNDKLEDPSLDRRSSLRPRRSGYAGMN